VALQDNFEEAIDLRSLHPFFCLPGKAQAGQEENFVPTRHPLQFGEEAFESLSFFADRLRVICVPADQAKGPCWARSLCQSLLGSEEFFLQIDSHMRFAPGWDHILLEDLRTCLKDTPRAVLTAYPPGYSEQDSFDSVPAERRPVLLCGWKFDAKGMLRTKGRLLKSPLEVPILSLFWAAGLSLSPSSFVREVPYDPSLEFVFFGEEPSMLCRMASWGWRCFCPSQSVVFHLWERGGRPSVPGSGQGEETEKKEKRERGEERIRQLIGLKKRNDTPGPPQQTVSVPRGPWSVPSADLDTGDGQGGSGHSEVPLLGPEATPRSLWAERGIDIDRTEVLPLAARGGFSHERSFAETEHKENVAEVLHLLAQKGLFGPG